MNANFDARLKANIFRLINDLVTNDDGIIEEQPDHVRRHFCSNEAFLNQLAAELSNQDLQSAQVQYRDVILSIVFRLHQHTPQVVGPVLLPVLDSHKAAIQAVLADPSADTELKEALSSELNTVEEAIEAPTRPFVQNFIQETEVEQVHNANKKPIQGLALKQ